MRIKISENFDGNKWDKIVSSVGGNIFHSNVWGHYNRAPNVVPQFISLLSNSGDLLGAALGFKSHSSKQLLKPFTSRLWFDASPVVRSNNKKELFEFLRLLKKHAYFSGIMEMSIGSFGSSFDSDMFEPLNFETIKRFEFIAHLDKNEDDLWKGLHSRRRRSIRHAQKRGVTISDLPVKQGVYELLRLQNESNMRILKRGGPDLTIKSAEMTKPIEFLLESGCARIAGAKVEGITEGACLFANFNGMANYMLAGYSDKGLNAQAGSLMLWENIKYYRSAGTKIISLGGCGADAVSPGSPEHGLLAFKKTFGAKRVECINRKVVLRQNTLSLFNTLKKVIETVEKAMKDHSKTYNQSLTKECIIADVA